MDSEYARSRTYSLLRLSRFPAIISICPLQVPMRSIESVSTAMSSIISFAAYGRASPSAWPTG